MYITRTDSEFTVKRKTGVFTAITLALVVLLSYYIVSQFINFPSEPLDEDTGGLFEASATILAFVSLGSVLGVRLNQNNMQSRVQFGGIILVLLCSAVVILIQTGIMLGLCCFTLDTHLCYTNDFYCHLFHCGSCWVHGIHIWSVRFIIILTNWL